jgi:hypothetical protein
MFPFLIRKTFFDLWDHLGVILLINLGYVALFAFAVYASSPLAPLHGVSLLLFVFKLALFFLYTGAVNRMIMLFFEPAGASLSDFMPCLAKSWKASLVFLMFALGIFLFLTAFYHYLTSLGGVASSVGLLTTFWITVILLMIGPYFFPFESISNENGLVCLKKALLLFVDNMPFSLGLLIGAMVIWGISTFSFFLFPGIGGLLLWYQTAVALRIVKYEALKQHPEADRNELRWEDLLKDDMERYRSRSFKNLIFPWK